MQECFNKNGGFSLPTRGGGARRRRMRLSIDDRREKINSKLGRLEAVELAQKKKSKSPKQRIVSKKTQEHVVPGLHMGGTGEGGGGGVCKVVLCSLKKHCANKRFTAEL